MSNKYDSCERCWRVPYEEGHEKWCATMSELEDKLQELIDKVNDMEREYGRHSHNMNYSRSRTGWPL